MNAGESVGKYLKRERETRNISLKEVAKNTKVREHLLRAIEEDQYHLLPPVTYVKGFLLGYARFLGLDPNEIIGRYESTLRGEPIPSPEGSPEKTPPRSAAHVWMIGGVIAASLIAAYFLYPSKPRVELIPEKPKVEEMIPPTPSPPPAETISVPEEKPFSLQLKAVERTWMSMKVDDQPDQEMMLNPGEEVTRQANKKIHLIVGNAGGLDILFNGRPLERFGKSGEVVILTCTSEGVEELKRPENPKNP